MKCKNCRHPIYYFKNWLYPGRNARHLLKDQKKIGYYFKCKGNCNCTKPLHPDYVNVWIIYCDLALSNVIEKYGTLADKIIDVNTGKQYTLLKNVELSKIGEVK